MKRGLLCRLNLCPRWVCRRSIEHPGFWETRCRRCGTLYGFADNPSRDFMVKVIA